MKRFLHPMVSRRQVLSGVAGLAGMPALAQAVKPGQTPKQVDDVDLYFAATPDPIVQRMFAMAKLNKNDVLVDLGSGDGKIPILAAKLFGIRARGVELVGERVAIARANARQAGVEHLVSFEQGDALEAKISDATVVTTYLFPHVMERLRPRLREQLKPGTRIVSHEFLMYGWQPKQTVDIGAVQIHLWVVE